LLSVTTVVEGGKEEKDNEPYAFLNR